MIAKAQNGKMLKFLTIKPNGFSLSEICHGILLWELDLNKIKKMVFWFCINSITLQP